MKFKIDVYDKNLDWAGRVGNPLSVTVTPRHNQQGTASITVDGDHDRLEDLIADGARMAIHHKPWPTLTKPRPEWEFLMSGPILSCRGEGPSAKSTLTVEMADDIWLLGAVRGWPVPGQPITNQAAAEYATYTGNAESILKSVATANVVNRLGLPVTVAANLNRGAVVPGGTAFRFHTLAEKLLQPLDVAGIGVQVRQQGAGLVLDVYEPRTFPHVLSETGGTITNWAWTRRAPEITRAVAGGKGDGTARAFRESINTALETAMGPLGIAEGFRDATDADTTTILQDRAAQEVAERGPRSGFSITLAGNGTFQYGQDGFLVGDRVPVRIGGVERTDVLRECTLSWSRAEGPNQAPVIGELESGSDRGLFRFIRNLATAVGQNRR